MFAHTSLEEVRLELEVKDGVKAVLFKDFEERRSGYEEQFDEQKLNRFLNAGQYPTVLPFDE